MKKINLNAIHVLTALAIIADVAVYFKSNSVPSQFSSLTYALVGGSLGITIPATPVTTTVSATTATA